MDRHGFPNQTDTDRNSSFEIIVSCAQRCILRNSTTSVIIISILTTMAGLLPLSGGCLSYLSHSNLHVHCSQTSYTVSFYATENSNLHVHCTLKTTACDMLVNAHCIIYSVYNISCISYTVL